MALTIDTTVDATVYTKNDCINCDKTKADLDALGANYKVINIQEDAQALKDLKEAGFRHAPVVTTSSGVAWSGYSREKIEEHFVK